MKLQVRRGPLTIALLAAAILLSALLPARPAGAGTARELQLQEIQTLIPHQNRIYLPADLRNGVHAQDGSTPVSVNVDTNWHRFGVVQNDRYQFQAQAGDLQIDLQSAHAAWIDLAVVDGQNGQALLEDTVLVNTSKTYALLLPQAGTYLLYIWGNRLDSITVTATGLVLPTVTPALILPRMDRFETHNEPFTYAVGLWNQAETERVTLYLDGRVISDQQIPPDGSTGPQPVTVETAGLSDDIHGLLVVSKARGSDNLGFDSLPFLVDRVDAFPDLPHSHWAHPYVEVMHHLGIINGRETGLYDPAAAVTRAEFAKLLALTLDIQASPDTQNPFVDTDGHWATPYILALWEQGLITGDVVNGHRYFYPSHTITRAEAATILGRALGLDNWPYTGEPFADWAEVPDWARPSVAALAQVGWINGFPDGRYHPADKLQRDQAAKILAKFFGM
jgi:hypothetical protein